MRRSDSWHMFVGFPTFRQASQSDYLTDGLVPVHEQGGPALKVIPDDLCTRCGVCEPICPTQVIDFDSRAFPFIETEGCINCGLCLKVCPGIEFDYTKEYKERFDVAPPPLWLGGFYRTAVLCSSTRSYVRLEGSGGGVVMQILLGMRSEKMIDGAITVGEDPADPLTPIPLICRTHGRPWPRLARSIVSCPTRRFYERSASNQVTTPLSAWAVRSRDCASSRKLGPVNTIATHRR